MEDDRPVTKREFDAGLAQLEARLEAKLAASLDAKLDAKLAAQTGRFEEFARDIETKLLTAFHGYGKGQALRMHTVESNYDSLKGHLEALEERVLNLETRPRL